MTTPVPRILLALDGKIDFVQATNPHVTKKQEKEWPPSPERRQEIAKGINRAFSSLASHPQR